MRLFSFFLFSLLLATPFISAQGQGQGQGNQGGGGGGRRDPISSGDGSKRDLSVPGGGPHVQLLGRSGQIRVSTGDDRSWIQLHWDKLVEVNANGQIVNQVPSFAGKSDLTWQAPVSTNITTASGSSVAATQLTMNGTVTVQRVGGGGGPPPSQSAYLILNVWILQGAANFSTNNSVLVAHNNDVKFTVEIDRWPFVSNTSSLKFGVSLLSFNANRTSYNTNPPGSGGTMFNGTRLSDPDDATHSRYCRLASGSVQSPQAGWSDNSTAPVKLEAYTAEDGAFGLSWIFPYFNNTFVFDPVISLDSSVTSSTPASPSSAASLAPFSALLAFLGTAAIFLFQ